MVPIRFFLCGDVMTGRGIDQVLQFPEDPRLYEPHVTDARDYVAISEQLYGPIPRPVDFRYIWGDAFDVWESMRPDLKIVNLETAVTRSNDAWPHKGIHYRMSPENIGCLTAAGIDCCALANNHVLDWGHPGLLETLETLAKAGIKFAGAGRNSAEAEAPAVLDAPGGGRALVMSMGWPTSGIPFNWAASGNRPGVCFLEPGSRSLGLVREVIHSTRRPGDVLIASIHWGPNWGYDISRSHVLFAHRLIDEANVDIVHGHSSHHVLGIEVYQGHLILYGCGDLVTDYEGIPGYGTFRGDLGLMYFADVNETGKLLALRMFPTQMRRFRLNRPAAADLQWLEATLDREGKKFGTSVRWADDALLLQWRSRQSEPERRR